MTCTLQEAIAFEGFCSNRGGQRPPPPSYVVMLPAKNEEMMMKNATFASAWGENSWGKMLTQCVYKSLDRIE